MAFFSPTYTFVNGSTADAAQVDQDFTDVVNALSDTTKDFSMANGTLAQTLSANGNVVLGSSSSKTLTINASIIQSVQVNANASYDLGGSTLGWKSIYIGAGSSGYTTRVQANSSMTGSWTLVLPVSAGSNNQVLVTDGSGNSSWQTNYTNNDGLLNYGLTASVGSSALTINLVGANGSTPSATNPVSVNFRSSTAATGTLSFVQATGATSITVPSGATLGMASGVTGYVWVWLLNNAGTIEMGVSGCSMATDEGSLYTTTAITSSSTVGNVIYSTSGRSNVPLRLIGRLQVNEATAGTWASSPTEISVTKFNPLTPSYAYLCEQQASGTNGGTATSGSWFARTLNTITDPDLIVTSLSSNIFTLIPGTYRIDATVPSRDCEEFQAQLYNTTDSTVTLSGMAAKSSGGSGIDCRSHILGVFTITASKSFEIREQVATTANTFGLGTATGNGFTVTNEVYTQVMLTKSR